jgi:regulatory protein
MAEMTPKERALALLDRRDYSRAELIRKLAEKGVPEADAAEAADRLAELGFVDDARYAPIVVRHYAAKGFGERRIRQELMRRGIPRELWDEALGEMPDQTGRIDALLRSRLSGADPGDRDALRRASDFLLRRGFDWDEVKEAVERYTSEYEDAD